MVDASTPAPWLQISALRQHAGPLQGVDLSVARGEMLCVIGGDDDSSASALLRCINGLQRFDEGRITLAGQPLQPHDGAALREWRQQVGLLLPHAALFPHLSVGRNVMLAPTLVKRRSAADVVDSARALLRRVGLADQFNARPEQLSSGAQQRVAIARALALEPSVLLCEHITQRLAPDEAHAVQRILTALQRDGLTLLLATQDLGLARLCQRVLFMHRGRVHETGPPATLLSQPQTPELRRVLASLES